MRRFRSLLNLAWRMLLHLLALPFRRPGDGERRFLDNYAADGLRPLSLGERRLLPALDRCIACGLCNAMCETLGAGPRHLFGGPFALAASARSMPDFPYFAAHLRDDADCGDCRRCETVCPTGVPLRDLARFIRAHGVPRLPNGAGVT